MDNQRGLEGSPVLWYDRILISYHIITYHIILYQVISYHIMSYHIISYHIISLSYHCHIMLLSYRYHIVIISLSYRYHSTYQFFRLHGPSKSFLLIMAIRWLSPAVRSITAIRVVCRDNKVAWDPSENSPDAGVGVTKVVASLWLLHWILYMYAVCVSTCMCMPCIYFACAYGMMKEHPLDKGTL